MVEPSATRDVSALHVWLRAIPALLWRRPLVRRDRAIADLQSPLQRVMGGDDAHRHRVHIRGTDGGLSRIGGIGLPDAPRQGDRADVPCRRNERFLDEDDFGDLWHHGVRVERRRPWDSKRTDPVGIGGQRAAPPEAWGGPRAFRARPDQSSPGACLDRSADLLATIQAGDLDEARDHLTALQPLAAWLALEHVDRWPVNRRLNRDTWGEEAWRGEEGEGVDDRPPPRHR